VDPRRPDRANHIATEAPLVYWFDLAGRLTSDETVAGIFESQVIEETEHGHICEHVAELVRRHRESIYAFVVAEDADRLVIHDKDGRIKPLKPGAGIKPNRSLSN
jgi:hypothetical protein